MGEGCDLERRPEAAAATRVELGRVEKDDAVGDGWRETEPERMFAESSKSLIEILGEQPAYFLMGVFAVVVPCVIVSWRAIRYFQWRAEEHWKERLDKAKERLDETRERLDEAKERLDETKSKLDETKDALKREQQKLKQLTKDFQTALAKLSEKDKELTGERDAVRKARNQVSTLQHELTQSRSRITQLEQASLQLQQRNDQAAKDVQIAVAKLSEREKELTREREKAQKANAQVTALQQQLAQPQTEAADRARAIVELQKQAQHANGEVSTLRQQVQQLQTTLAGQAESLQNLGAKIQEQARHILERDGTIATLRKKLAVEEQSVGSPPIENAWERTIDSTTPSFRPRADRQAPIISVLNLKGGVGKTTITANLGATLWQQGQKVLLLDLDFQGSLTSRCLSQETQEKLLGSGKYAEDFFLNRERESDLAAALIRRVTPITFGELKIAVKPGVGSGFLLPADERLADIETGLMVRWVYQKGHDIRFLLRQALQDSRVADDYTCIFLDCPPRLTTASVNALACSDYVVIPVVLDATSTERVPMLLGWLQRFLECGVCPDLQGVAVVANMIQRNNRGNLIDQEEQAWKNLQGTCRDVWRGGELLFATSMIRQDGRFGEATVEHLPAVLRGIAGFERLRTEFENLARELRDEGFLPS